MSYLYGEMPPDVARTFERHLKECPACQKDVEDFRLVRQTLADWELEDIPHIRLAIEPRPKLRWLDVLKEMPLWTRLVATAAAAMLLVSLFNVRVGYNSSDGFQFRASLFPRQQAQPPTNQSGLSQEQTVALIQTMLQQDEARRNQEVAAAIEDMANQMKEENRQMLITFAQTLRREQTQRLAEYWSTAENQSSVPTLSDLFSEGRGGSN
jgi:hypothetical protein